MKRVILSMTVLLLLFVNCDKKCKKEPCEDDPCKIERPNDLKPIDWENYNSAYDIVWNYRVPMNNDVTDWGKEIMAYGWMSHSPDAPPYRAFILVADTSRDNRIIIPVYPYAYVIQSDNEVFVDSLHSIFQSTDLNRKCFIKGELWYIPAGDPCDYVMVTITIKNTKNIYFE